MRDKWKLAVDNELVTSHLGTEDSYDSPISAVKDLCFYSQELGAYFERERFKKDIERLTNALRECLDFVERHSNRWDGSVGKHPQMVADFSRQLLSELEEKYALLAELETAK